jgi:POT family proton-dependent oligopeptide transporter
MAAQPFLTAPLKTDQMPPGIPYIVGNEAAERFNFYGMRAVLVVFMTKYLVRPDWGAGADDRERCEQVVSPFPVGELFLPDHRGDRFGRVLGQIQDHHAAVGRVLRLGSLVLALDHTRLGLTLGLTLIAIGAGGIKPCVSSHVGDQFGSGNRHLLARAFGWFYFSVNFGAFFSVLLIPVLLDRSGPGSAFGLPAVLMVLAALIFWRGRHRFAHIPPGGRTFLRDTFNREGFATLGRIAIIFVFVAVFWSLWDQSGGEWITQAAKMDLHFAGLNWLPSQIGAVNSIMVLAFIPLFQYVVYPAISRVFPLTSLRKIGIGLVLTGLSFTISACDSRRSWPRA